MLKPFLTGTLLAISASAASAADLLPDIADTAPIALAHDWSGPYLGVHLGGIFTEFDNDVPANPGPVGDAGGLIAGVQAGYNWQFGRWVAGIEADLSSIDLEGNSAFGSFEEDVMGTLRLRGGFAWDRFLIYATAGAAFTHVEAQLTGAGSDDDIAVGPAAGIGVEAALWRNWSVRAEYLYAHVPEQSLSTGAITTIGGSNNHIGRVGVNLHF
jgi:outer membrane immunogenic protein